MPDTLTFATNNAYLMTEARLVIQPIMSLVDTGIIVPVDTAGGGLHDIARRRARAVFDILGTHVFAEVDGTYVDALGGYPGVCPDGIDFRSKYVSELLRLMRGVSHRGAVQRTVLCYIDDNGYETYFEHMRHGVISTYPKGPTIAGYDRVFEVNNLRYVDMKDTVRSVYCQRFHVYRQLRDFLGYEIIRPDTDDNKIE